MSVKNHTQSNKPDQVDPLQEKLKQIVELQKGINILKSRATQQKQDLIEYCTKHPQYQQTTFNVDDYTVRYTNKKSTDGITQKLIIAGLTQYFKSHNVNDIGKEVSQALTLIKNTRQSKITPTIDVRAKNIHIDKHE